MLRSRAVPLLAAAGLGSGIYWQTRGGRNQPEGRTTGSQTGLSETMQGMAGSGGPRARKGGGMDDSSKDTKLYSRSPTADAKRSPQKVRDDELGD